MFSLAVQFDFQFFYISCSSLRIGYEPYRILIPFEIPSICSKNVWPFGGESIPRKEFQYFEINFTFNLQIKR